MIRVEREGSVAVVMLFHGVTNPIGPELVELLSGVICGLRDDSEVNGLVLASANNKFFSIGFDLPAIYEFDEAALASFYDQFCNLCLDLFTWPGPTAAAVSGHAVAGGCILSLCCDYRVMAEGRTLIGLNEISLGVPVPHLPQLASAEVCGPRHARELVDSGELIGVERALEIGLADRAVAREQVRSETQAHVQELASLPTAAFVANKNQRNASIAARVRYAHEERRDEFVSLWFSDEARIRLAAAREMF